MQSSRGKAGRIFGAILVAAGVFVTGLTAPGLPAPSFPLASARAGAVRIHILVTPAGSATPVDFYGSGWTRACVPVGRRYHLVIATAAHVVDLPELAAALHTPGISSAKVVVAYRDGRQLSAGRDALRVDRAHDYAEVRVTSPVAQKKWGHPPSPRSMSGACGRLPRDLVGVPIFSGRALASIASPGGIPFGAYRGHVVLDGGFPLADMPADAWLAAMAGIGPGASGAPVLDGQGRAVATVIGLVRWRWGGSLVVIVPIPSHPNFGGAS